MGFICQHCRFGLGYSLAMTTTCLYQRQGGTCMGSHTHACGYYFGFIFSSFESSVGTFGHQGTPKVTIVY